MKALASTLRVFAVKNIGTLENFESVSPDDHITWGRTVTQSLKKLYDDIEELQEQCEGIITECNILRNQITGSSADFKKWQLRWENARALCDLF